MRRVWRGVRVSLLAGAVLLAAALALAAVLTRTEKGQNLVLREALRRGQGMVHGSLEVERASSSDLLRGVRLHGVRIADPRGRSVIEVDSLHATYTLRSLLSQGIVLRSLELFRPVVTVERLPGEESFVIARVFAGPGEAPVEAPEPSGPGRRILVRDVAARQGEIVVRLPVEEGDEVPGWARAVPFPEAPGTAMELSLEALEAELPEVVAGGGSPIRLSLRRLSMRARVGAEPVEVRRLAGAARIDAGRLSLDLRELALPGSRASGEVAVDWSGADGPSVSAALDVPELALADLRWIVSDLPDGAGRAQVELAWGPGGTSLAVREGELTSEGSVVRGEGRLELGDGLTVRAADLRLAPLRLTTLEPWLPDDFPLIGAALSGRVRLDGPLSRLGADGTLSLQEPASPRPTATARFSGIVHAGDAPGVTGLTLDLDPFEFGLAGRFLPAVAVEGPGSVHLEATGRLGGEVRLAAEVRHLPAGVPASRVTIRGTMRGRGDAMALDLEGELDPLSLTALGAYYPGLPAFGEVSGPVVVRGSVPDLTVAGTLATPGGRVTLEARFDARDPAAGYRATGSVADLEATRFVEGLPVPTVVSATFSVEGRGLTRETVEGSGTVLVGPSTVGRLDVDTADLRVRVQGGTLHLDTLQLRAAGVEVRGGGRLALAAGAADGELHLDFSADSLALLGPLLGGDVDADADTLSALPLGVLDFRDADADAPVNGGGGTVAGRARGRATLRGAVDDFALEGRVEVEDVVYGDHGVQRGTLTVSGTGLPGPERRLGMELAADSVRIFERRFRSGALEGEYAAGNGRATLVLERDGGEDYRARATIEVDSLGGTVHLDQLVLRFDTVRWSLSGPATVAWSDAGVTVDDFRLVRPGLDAMHIEADGILPLRGDADFGLRVRGLSLARLAHVGQLETDLHGVLEADLRVEGEALAPVLTGSLAVREFRYEDVDLTLVEAEFEYRERELRAGLNADRAGTRVLVAEGLVPLDLSFQKVERRLLDRPVHVTASLDSIPAALLMGFLDAFEDVDGTVSGELRLAGTPDDLRPEGTLRLTDGSALLPELGVRHRDVRALVHLNRDRTVVVEGQARARGTARVAGTLDLTTPGDPGLDLRITASGFQALERRDMEGRVGGDVRIRGSYRRPLVEGSVRVEQGVLFLEEFERTTEVVDLSDPSFFDVVDTALVAVRPILAESQNPFFQNLRMDVSLVVERDTWLRSSQLNVEIGGALLVTYDRTRNDLVLVGQLEAIRGNYSPPYLRRQFQVQEGTVDFVGTPGLDPNLSIRAVTRLRTANQEPLDIVATVEGTLTQPRVSLSSIAQPPIAESDLVSYLLFGRPSYALASGQSAQVEGAAGLLGPAQGAIRSIGVGAVAGQLGSAVAQQIGLDYFAVTQTQDAAAEAGGVGVADLRGTLAATQVEIGQYLLQNVFVGVLLRPVRTAGSSWISGGRVEWRLADLWSLEGFVEDRFARQGVAGFGEVAFLTQRVGGFFLFREWGY